ncbi:MAG TPA: hypothetical protein VGO43_08785 [Pyrinomonadaceae bacterium]|nr:hypothetical protein [Pyrinomonadaceae bacterium]
MFTDTVGPTVDHLPLFAAISSCDRCFDIGYRISPTGPVEACPTLQCGNPHPRLSDAGQMIDRSIRLLVHRKLDVDPRHFEIARTLAGFSFDKPCGNDELVRRHFAWVNAEHRRIKNVDEAQRREVAKAVRFLREIWFLPVGSRKDRPSGYWICVNEAEFKEYFERASREPVTTLSTLHRLAKANWPLFAKQIEIKLDDDVEEVQEIPEAA